MKTNFLILIVFAGIVVGCKGQQAEENPIVDENIPVKVIPLVQESTSTTFQSAGYFTTDNETPLSFKNGGIITRIFVQEGDGIKAGQILATVNATELDAAADQAGLALSKAERDYQRAFNLYRDSVATLEQMQNAKTALEVARKQMDVVNFNLAHTQLKAIKSGFVLKKFMNEGQVVGPGMPVLLVNGVTGNNWLFKVGVTDQQWAAIKIGDSAEIKTDVLPDKIISAVVSKKNEGVNTQSGAFEVQLRIKNKEEMPLAAGLFGRVTFYPSKKIEGWEIPLESILDGDEHSARVFVTDDGKKAREIKVPITSVSHGGVLVLSGLEDVKYLITSGNAYLKDGSTIHIISSTD